MFKRLNKIINYSINLEHNLKHYKIFRPVERAQLIKPMAYQFMHLYQQNLYKPNKRFSERQIVNFTKSLTEYDMLQPKRVQKIVDHLIKNIDQIKVFTSIVRFCRFMYSAQFKDKQKVAMIAQKGFSLIKHNKVQNFQTLVQGYHISFFLIVCDGFKIIPQVLTKQSKEILQSSIQYFRPQFLPIILQILINNGISSEESLIRQILNKIYKAKKFLEQYQIKILKILPIDNKEYTDFIKTL